MMGDVLENDTRAGWLPLPRKAVREMCAGGNYGSVGKGVRSRESTEVKGRDLCLGRA